MKTLALLMVATITSASIAGAQSLAFDFDTDGDPTTIESETAAEVGDIVEAYLVVNDIPPGYAYLHGLQFGLALTDGLQFVGMSIVGLEGGMGSDGHEGIVVTPTEPMPAEEFPSFAMRFALRVWSLEPQVASIVPSTGWDTTFDGFVFLVSNTGNLEDAVTLEDLGAISTQRVAQINGAATPVQVVSWGNLKGHF